MDLPVLNPFDVDESDDLDTPPCTCPEAEVAQGSSSVPVMIIPTKELQKIKAPVVITGEAFIRDLIENRWKLTDKFMYSIKFREVSRNEASMFYHFEVIFSQPTPAYPLPPAICSVFFKVQVSQTDPPKEHKPSILWWRVEGHHSEYDARFVRLTEHPIFEVLFMKIKLFKRIESYDTF